MEYFSAIRRNECESAELTWMNLEPVIQSEVSPKEKNKYRILTHMESRRRVLMNPFAGRNRDAEAEEGLVDTVGEGEGGAD